MRYALKKKNHSKKGNFYIKNIGKSPERITLSYAIITKSVLTALHIVRVERQAYLNISR